MPFTDPIARRAYQRIWRLFHPVDPVDHASRAKAWYHTPKGFAAAASIARRRATLFRLWWGVSEGTLMCRISPPFHAKRKASWNKTYTRHRLRRLAYATKKQRDSVLQLSDRYVRRAFVGRSYFLSPRMVPKELIELQRARLLLFRELKKLSQHKSPQ